jgi:Mycobacterium membrane protein
MTASSTPGTGKGGREVMRALRTLQRGWIPLVLVAALALSGLTIYRMHGIFGSHQTPGTDPGFRQPYLLLGAGLPDRDAAKAAWRLNS